ncbi:tail fiber protein [Methylobacterium sp. sgz302541]|uniref:tail fiber protein n=1 Tax=unclassified Methylobacterium TaxID=2615210 RepID=UPI003D33C9E4
MAGLVDFSIDAASNDSIAPPIYWAEGQPAATVNNSAREMMAALAKWHADNTGALVARRGASDVYAVATNQVLSVNSAAAAHTLSFTVDAANQGPASLAPDGQPARPLFRPFGRQLGPGDLAPDIVFTAHYRPSSGAYFIVAPFIERPGVFKPQGDVTPDAGWVPMDGRLLSRTAYAALFAQVGTTFGPGDGATTFNAPNANGKTLFGPGGTLGGVGSTGGSETVTLALSQVPAHTHGGSTNAAGGHDHGGAVGAAGSHSHGGTTGAAGGHNHTGTTGGAGGHGHTGTTSIAGNHAHAIQFTQASTYQAGGGGAATAIGAIYPTGTPNAGGQTDGNGAHQHTLNVDPVADHQHGFTTGAVADHAHAIAADGNHQHAISAAPDHAHALTTNSAGGDGAHSNMPPGLVAFYVVKA